MHIQLLSTLRLGRLLVLVCVFVFGLRLGVQAQDQEPIYTIPVVVHLIYYPNSTLQSHDANLTDCHVHRAIKELNKTFSQTHGLDIPEMFQSVAAGDTRIRFELATIDPNGNPTTGITRHPVVGALAEAVSEFLDGFDPSAFSPLNDAVGPWHTGKYMNIYVYPFSVTTVEAASIRPQDGFHLDNLGRDFVMVNNYAFSPFPPLLRGYTLSRALVQRVGWYLSLYHLFSLNCTGRGDLCDDTPETNSPGEGCSRRGQTCDSNGPPSMIENYMSLSGDDCKRLFTSCQKGRMRNALSTFRRNLHADGNSALSGSRPAIDMAIYKDFYQSRPSIEFIDPATVRFRVPDIFVTQQGPSPINSLNVSFAINGEKIASYREERTFNFCDIDTLRVPSSIQDLLGATPLENGREYTLSIWVDAQGETDRTNDTLRVSIVSPHTLIVTTEPLSPLPATGGEVEVIIDVGGASAGWEIIRARPENTFLSVHPQSSGNTDDTLTIRYDENTTIHSRRGQVAVNTVGEGTRVSKILTFGQLGIPTLHELALTTTPSALNALPSASGEVRVNINIGGYTEVWNATTSSDFLTLSSASGTKDANLTISYEANTGTASRTGEVLISTQGSFGESIEKTLTLKQLFSNALGIYEEVDRTSSLTKLFPNPSKGEVFLFVKTGKKQEIQVSFFDASGNLGYRQDFEVSPNNNRIAFSPNLARGGLYFVHIKAENLDEVKRLLMH